MWDFSNLLSFPQQWKTIFKESSIVPSIVTRNTINRDVEKEAEFYKVLSIMSDSRRQLLIIQRSRLFLTWFRIVYFS